jgi:CBS domain-containing protein
MGLFFNPFLIFIALFVWLAGSQEAGFVLIRSALGDVPVMRAMITDFRVLGADDRLSKGVEYLLSGFQQDFPVVDNGRVVGVLTLSDLAAALGSNGPETIVENVMQREFATASPHDMLQTAFARLQEGQCRTIPVLKDGRLEGLLTADHLAEVMMIRQALQEARRPGLNPWPRPFGRASLRADRLSRSNNWANPVG